MKSTTIHGLDDKLAALISEKAQRQGVSLNQTMKTLLREALGISAETAKNKQASFQDIFGTWSKIDEKAFNNKAKKFEVIDHEDWS